MLFLKKIRNSKLCIKCNSQTYFDYSTLCLFCGQHYMKIEFNHIRRYIPTPHTKKKLFEVLHIECPQEEVEVVSSSEKKEEK